MLFSERHSNERIPKHQTETKKKVTRTGLSFLSVVLQCVWKTGSYTTLNQCCGVHIIKRLIVSKVAVEKLKEMSWTSIPEQNPCVQNNFPEKS